MHPMPTHRIRINPKAQFGFYEPPPDYRARARDQFFRRSTFLWWITILCTNLFWINEWLILRSTFVFTLILKLRSTNVLILKMDSENGNKILGIWISIFLGFGFWRDFGFSPQEGFGEECGRNFSLVYYITRCNLMQLGIYFSYVIRNKTRAKFKKIPLKKELVTR